MNGDRHIKLLPEGKMPEWLAVKSTTLESWW